MRDRLDAALARHRAISLVALALLTGLAWVWLIAGAEMPMAGSAENPMSAMASAESGSSWSRARYLLTFSMWATMMVAMMLPSAAPVILLYKRVAIRSIPSADHSTGMFLAGYLAAWGLFSLIIAALQGFLEHLGLLGAMDQAPGSRQFQGLLLLATGAYQLSPLKNACLHQCRNPAQFLARHYRAGPWGAARMGVTHGAFCVGCCWLLMALLFVGGVMNLAWIGGLTVVVAAEKLLPGGRHLARIAGVACLAWGGYQLAG